jgi:hypothetical protein
MQEVIIVRTKRPNIIPFVDGGWANASAWSLLLSEFDEAVNALRKAWQQVKATEPTVQQLVATWRERQAIAPDQLLTEESEEIWLLLMPEVGIARGNMHNLIEQAVTRWHDVLIRYFRLLDATKAVEGPLVKASRLVDGRTNTSGKAA